MEVEKPRASCIILTVIRHSFLLRTVSKRAPRINGCLKSLSAKGDGAPEHLMSYMKVEETAAVPKVWSSDQQPHLHQEASETNLLSGPSQTYQLRTSAGEAQQSVF